MQQHNAGVAVKQGCQQQRQQQLRRHGAECHNTPPTGYTQALPLSIARFSDPICGQSCQKRHKNQHRQTHIYHHIPPISDATSRKTSKNGCGCRPKITITITKTANGNIIIHPGSFTSGTAQ